MKIDQKRVLPFAFVMVILSLTGLYQNCSGVQSAQQFDAASTTESNQENANGYKWMIVQTSACSKVCGEGQQIRVVECRDAHNVRSEDQFCRGLTRPPATATCGAPLTVKCGNNGTARCNSAGTGYGSCTVLLPPSESTPTPTPTPTPVAVATPFPDGSTPLCRPEVAVIADTVCSRSNSNFFEYARVATAKECADFCRTRSSANCANFYVEVNRAVYSLPNNCECLPSVGRNVVNTPTPDWDVYALPICR
jgi:hypothetical protein